MPACATEPGTRSAVAIATAPRPRCRREERSLGTDIWDTSSERRSGQVRMDGGASQYDHRRETSRSRRHEPKTPQLCGDVARRPSHPPVGVPVVGGCAPARASRPPTCCWRASATGRNLRAPMTEPSEPASVVRSDAHGSRERILDAARRCARGQPVGKPHRHRGLGRGLASDGLSPLQRCLRHPRGIRCRGADHWAERPTGRAADLPRARSRRHHRRARSLHRQILPIEHRWTRLIAGEPLPDAPIFEAFLPIVQAVIRRGQQQGSSAPISTSSLPRTPWWPS